MRDNDPQLELLSLILMDMRSTVESMRRSVTNAQSSIEQCRHKPTEKTLKDIADCLRQLGNEASIVTQSSNTAAEPLPALINAMATPS